MNGYSKHFVACLSLLFFSCIVCSASVMCDEEKDNTKAVPIVVSDTSQNLHRGLTPEINAYYLNGYVHIFFNGVSGNVLVTVNNVTAGGQVQNLFDASFMNVSMDIRSILTSGEYYIELVLDNFDTFIGDFSL